MSQQARHAGERIHPTAVVDPDARLDPSVSVGPHAHIGPDVEIGAGTRIGPHAVIQGPTRIGRDNHIHAHACLGDAPQDISYRGEPTRLEIGDGNTIREFVSMHRASTKEEGVTRVGSGGFFMAYSHVAHDCVVGDGVVMANNAIIGGHVHVGNRVNIGAMSAVHQFVHIGDYAMIGGGSIILMDVAPFMTASGNRARLYGLNRRGLKRADFPAETIQALQRAYRLVFRSGLPLRTALERLRENAGSAEVQSLLAFLETSRRGVLR